MAPNDSPHSIHSRVLKSPVAGVKAGIKAQKPKKPKAPRRTLEQKVGDLCARMRKEGASLMVVNKRKVVMSHTGSPISLALILAAVEAGKLAPWKASLFDDPAIPPQQYILREQLDE